MNNIPIWFMRQAGRYLPEYRLIRKEKTDFLDLCLNPDLASVISMQPIKRFDFDFIILFSDILVVPYALGQNVKFLKNHGPSLETEQIDNCIRNVDFEESIKKIANIFKTIKILSKMKKEKKLIGFCGGPFTVLNYMVEGGTSKDHKKIKKFIKYQREKAEKLMYYLTEFSIEYLKQQISHGADYIKIFESWASLLEGEEYENFIIKPNRKISEEIKKFSKETKIIHFPRGSKTNYIKFIEEVYCDVIGLDLNFPEEVLKISKRKGITVQGNLNPEDLVAGGEKLKIKVIEVLRKFKHNNHIFNLSHGILPQTPIENVERTIKIIKEHEIT